LSNKWNSQGKTAYPVKDSESLIFLLKKDINMGELTGSNWTSIGSETHPFEAAFYGENHTITATLNSSSGLWNDISNAAIQDFTLQVNANGTSSKFLANEVHNASLKDIIVKGTWNASLKTGGYSGVLYNVENSILDNISIDLNTTVNNPASSIDISIFTGSTKSSTLNRVSLNGSFTITNNDPYNFYFAGFGLISDNDKITNCEYNMDIRMAPGNFSTSISILYDKIKNNTVIDKMNIKKADVTMDPYDAGRLIGAIDKTCTNCIISNLEDNTVYRNLDPNSTDSFNEYIVWENGGDLKIVNSCFNGNITGDSSYMSGFRYMDFYNLILADFTILTNVVSTRQDVYLKADIDAKKVTASMMNQNLVDHKESMPSGVYLPWKQDSDGTFHLKFDASGSEMYVIP
jgi:hypothetical protein